jgi:hypothetical protein
MEPDGLIPSSLELTNGIYHDKVEYILKPTVRSILTRLSHLRLGLPSGLLLSRFPTQILYAFLTSPMCATYLIHPIFLDVITNNIWFRVNIANLHSVFSRLLFSSHLGRYFLLSLFWGTLNIGLFLIWKTTFHSHGKHGKILMSFNNPN